MPFVFLYSAKILLGISNISINNKSSLQRGAKYFVNYCSGCHSLKYMRMSTLAEDLDIDEALFSKNLLFNNKKIIIS